MTTPRETQDDPAEAMCEVLWQDLWRFRTFTAHLMEESRGNQETFRSISAVLNDIDGFLGYLTDEPEHYLVLVQFMRHCGAETLKRALTYVPSSKPRP